MKRVVFAFFLIVVSADLVFSQDIIVLRDGDEIEAKVMEIAPDVIKYKKYSNQDGPMYSIEKFKVFMIKFEDGSKEVFKEEQQTPVASVNEYDRQKLLGKQEPLPGGVFNFNLLGLLQFGPIFQYEAKIADQLFVTTHFRYAFAGLTYHILWDYDIEDDQMQPGAGGLGLGFKGFSNEMGHSWYYGGFVEYAWTTVNWNVDEAWETEQKYRGVIPAGNFGYRWRNESGFLVNLGLVAGAAISLSNDEVYVNSGEIYDSYDEVRPFAFLELAFGFEIN